MIAELHGKSRREDLLTSYVFGIIANHGILPAFRQWFATAVLVSDGAFPKNLAPPADGHLHVAFWPSFGRFGIPDAALIVDNANQRTIIGVEVKDASGLGRHDQLDYAKALTLSTDLPLNTWRVRPRLGSLSPPDITALLYVTRGLRVPINDVKGCRNSKVPVYWLSWRGLFRCLKEQGSLSCARCQAQIDDLCAVLARRNLFSFDGFGELDPWSGSVDFYH